MAGSVGRNWVVPFQDRNSRSYVSSSRIAYSRSVNWFARSRVEKNFPAPTTVRLNASLFRDCFHRDLPVSIFLLCAQVTLVAIERAERVATRATFVFIMLANTWYNRR